MGWILLAAFGHMLGSGATLLDKELLKKISPRVFFVISEIPWLCVLLFLPFAEIWNARVASFAGSWALFRHPVSMWEWIIMLRPGVCAAVSVLFLYGATRRDAPSRVVLTIGIVKPVAAAAVSVFWFGRIFSGREIVALLLFLAAAWSAGVLFFRRTASLPEEGTLFSLACACAAGAGFGLHILWWKQAVDSSSFVTASYWQSIGQVSVAAIVFLFSVRPVMTWISEQVWGMQRSSHHAVPNIKQPFRRFLRLFAANKAFGIASVSMVLCAGAYGDPVFVSSFDGAKYLTAFFNEYRVGVRRTLGMRWAIFAGILLGAGLAILAFLRKGAG